MKKEEEKNVLSEFRALIRCGRGKAYLLLIENPDLDFSDDIYKAAIKNYAYDGQSEGDRADYIIPFLQSLPKDQFKKLKKKIVKRLYKEDKDTWNLKQIFNICAYFAIQDHSIKKGIYERFEQTPIPSSDWVGSDAILRLDGTKGMMRIAEHFGKRLMEIEGEWHDDSLVYLFDKKNPKVQIKKLLKKESKHNVYIKTYLKEIESTRDRWNKHRDRRQKWTDQTIMNHLLDDKKTGSMYSIIRVLNPTQRTKIAELLKEKQSIQTINKVLYVFNHSQYPLSIEYLKAFYKKKYTAETRELAFQALCFFKDDKIRAHAIEKLRKTNNPAKYLAAFKLNYRKGDSTLFEQVIDRFTSTHIVEQLAISLCDIYEYNHTKECKKPLLKLYEKMNCGILRHAIIGILYENQVLPKSVLKEMEFDSYDKTREFFKKIIKENKI